MNRTTEIRRVKSNQGAGARTVRPLEDSPRPVTRPMSLERFQSIVLRLGNQMFVRHYLWLNYPHSPQLMGIELIGQAPNGKKRVSSCECGACQKCLHRIYMQGYRKAGRLATELEREGFAFDEPLGIWTIERSA